MAPHASARRAFAAASLLAALAGTSACTPHDPGPPSGPTSSDTTPAGEDAAVPAPSTGTSASQAAVATADLACVPGDDLDLSWLTSHGQVRPDLDPSETVMVEVGPGNDPAETWWVVAAASYSDAWGTRGEYNPVSFLTTAPSGRDDARWISIGRALTAPAGTSDWSDVTWTGDRLERGQRAQAVALACLDPST